MALYYCYPCNTTFHNSSPHCTQCEGDFVEDMMDERAEDGAVNIISSLLNNPGLAHNLVQAINISEEGAEENEADGADDDSENDEGQSEELVDDYQDHTTGDQSYSRFPNLLSSLQPHFQAHQAAISSSLSQQSTHPDVQRMIQEAIQRQFALVQERLGQEQNAQQEQSRQQEQSDDNGASNQPRTIRIPLGAGNELLVVMSSSPFNNIFNEQSGQSILQPLFRLFGFAGDPRDYVNDPERFNELLDHLFRNSEHTTRGLDQTAIDKLLRNKGSDLMGTRSIDKCPVCMDQMNEDSVCIELKCKHLFHENCLVPWLERCASCPVCRAIVSIDKE